MATTPTALPTLAPTLTPSPTRTPTAINTPTRTPTAGPTMTGTPNAVSMLSGSSIIRSQLDPSMAYVHLGNFPIAPNYSISPLFDPSYRTDSQGVVWEVVGFYYYLDPDTYTNPSNFYLQPYETNLFIDSTVEGLQAFYSENIAASSGFGCYDAEIYTGSFDFMCDRAFEAVYDSEPTFANWFDNIFGQEQVGLLFHSHARHIFNPTENFSIDLAWVGGAVPWDNNFPTPPPLLTSDVSLWGIMRYPYANFNPPPSTPEPPQCTEVVFTAPACANHVVYWINNHPTEDVFTIDSCYGASLVGDVGLDKITAGLSYTEYAGSGNTVMGLGTYIDLGASYPLTEFKFKATNWSNTPDIYTSNIWVWDGSLWVLAGGNSIYDEWTWASLNGSYSKIYIANSALKSPRWAASSNHEVLFSDMLLSIEGGGQVQLSPDTTLCQPVTPTSTPMATSAYTATPQSVATFTRTPTRTPSPTATQSVDSYCMNPRWRQTPTPTIAATGTLNATQTIAAATRTPNSRPTLESQFTQTAAVVTATANQNATATQIQGATQTAIPSATAAQQATTTQIAAGTQTAVFPATGTWIASTPGNEVVATWDGMSTQIVNMAKTGTPVALGGYSPYTINIGNPAPDGGNSTIDFNNINTDTLLAFKWDPQPKKGVCYTIVPQTNVYQQALEPVVSNDPTGGLASGVIGAIIARYFTSKDENNDGLNDNKRVNVDIPEFRVCVNWINIPTIIIAGIRLPVELYLIPIFMVVFRYIWRLL